MQKDKKRFKDTKVGSFLADKAPHIFEVVSELTPDAGLLSAVGKLVAGDPGMSDATKLEFERIRLQAEIDAQEQVTRRWEADMKSSSKLSQNIRPAVLIAMTVSLILFSALDASENAGFDMPSEWISLLTTISTTVFAAYFAGRSWEKIKTT